MSDVITPDNKSVEQLHAEVVALIKTGQAKVDQQLREIEDRGKASEALGSEITKIFGEVASLKEQLELVRADMNRPDSGGEASQTEGVCDRLMKNEQFKAFMERGWHKGSIVANLAGFFPERAQTVITSSTVGTSTAGILTPARVQDYVPKPQRRLTLRDLFMAIPVTQASVEYIQESAFTNAASPQVEAAAKGESALTFTIATANVRTIAHHIPATRQVLDDWVQLRRIIDSKMLYGLKLKEEAEILSGSGTGAHLNGLTTQAASYAGTYNDTGDTRIDKLLNAQAELAMADEMEPDFAVISPVDFLRILKVKDQASGVGNYVVGSPFGPVQARTLNGSALVVTPSMTAGYFLVGNSEMADIFDRQQATVMISTEHANHFTENKVEILVEERIALAAYRTTAFLYGAF